MTSAHRIETELDRYDGYLTSHWIEYGMPLASGVAFDKAVVEAAVIGRLFRDKLIELGLDEEEANKRIIHRTKYIGQKLADHRSEFFAMPEKFVLPGGSLYFEGYIASEAYRKFKKLCFENEGVLQKQEPAGLTL